MPRRPALVVACFLAIYLLWGSTYLAVAFGLKSFPPFMLMATRSIAGGIILLSLTWHEIAGISARAWVRAAGSGLLFFLGCHLHARGAKVLQQLAIGGARKEIEDRPRNSRPDLLHAF